MTEPVSPTDGWGVVHFFCKPTPLFDGEAVVAAVKQMEADDHQVVPAAILGHKADFCLLAIGPDLRRLWAFQTAIQQAGLEVVDSYVSLTEVSEYAKGAPEELKRPRLYPKFPPEGLPAFCFYPMSKRRDPQANWYALPYEERLELMMEHGASGRKFHGRITQFVTGSAGLDDYEWGVTLFGKHPDDLKDAVYTMRFDRASAQFGDFGTFYAGVVCTIEELVAGR